MSKTVFKKHCIMEVVQLTVPELVAFLNDAWPPQII